MCETTDPLERSAAGPRKPTRRTRSSEAPCEKTHRRLLGVRAINLAAAERDVPGPLADLLLQFARDSRPALGGPSCEASRHSRIRIPTLPGGCLT